MDGDGAKKIWTELENRRFGAKLCFFFGAWHFFPAVVDWKMPDAPYGVRSGLSMGTVFFAMGLVARFV